MPVTIKYYNFTPNMSSMSEVVETANSFTDYLFGPVIILCFFLVLFITFLYSGKRMSVCLTASLFPTALVSSFLALIPNFLSWEITIGLWMATGLSAALLYFDTKD